MRCLLPSGVVKCNVFDFIGNSTPPYGTDSNDAVSVTLSQLIPTHLRNSKLCCHGDQHTDYK